MLYRVRKQYTLSFKGKDLSGGTVVDLTPEEFKAHAALLEAVPEEKPVPAPAPVVEDPTGQEGEQVETEDVVMGIETNRAIVKPHSRRRVGK